jgi:hypothetical protein
MERKEVPELYTLLREVEKKFGRPLECTNDFRVLSALIEYECKEAVSVSTLKRLWGYVSQKTTPREATLDVLARFLNYQDFRVFRILGLGQASDCSEYVETSYLSAADVAEGACVTVGWAPNRVLRIKKTGDIQWEVLSSQNSKLKAGDRFEASCFFKGLPLFLPSIIRGGQELPSYIAGKKEGLNVVSVEA